MPIYEYRCTECQQLIERYCRQIEDESVQHRCPICGGKTRRLISNTSFALKGDGWYVTEYGSHKGIKEEGSAPSTPPASSAAPSKAAPKAASKEGGDKPAPGSPPVQ